MASTQFDPMRPPGMLVSKGACLAIDSGGTLLYQKGRRLAKIKLNALQWQLFANMIGRKLESNHRGRIKLETEYNGSVHITRANEGGITLTLRNSYSPQQRSLVCPLTRREAEQLRESSRLHAPKLSDGTNSTQ